MSKIGRRPINTKGVTVQLDGLHLTLKNSKGSFEHTLPDTLHVTLKDDTMTLSSSSMQRKDKMVWGLHRALLANKVKGLLEGFSRKVNLVGLGYKGQLSGKTITFSLGYSHKITYDIPQGVTVDIDKTGQVLIVSGQDKFMVGNVCDAIRSFKKVEPYKGTGIVREGDVIIRKAGKTKA